MSAANEDREDGGIDEEATTDKWVGEEIDEDEDYSETKASAPGYGGEEKDSEGNRGDRGDEEDNMTYDTDTGTIDHTIVVFLTRHVLSVWGQLIFMLGPKIEACKTPQNDL